MFRVRLEKEQHVFSAAHFITFAGQVCERLHGHNYGVAVEVEGPLDENHYVVDFIALRDELRTLTDELDHRVLLPMSHPLIRVTERAAVRQDVCTGDSNSQASSRDGEVEAVFTPDGRRWIFPRGDCALLPVSNTTAELLAQHLGQRLLAALIQRMNFRPTKIEVAVDENHGQWGVWMGPGEG